MQITIKRKIKDSEMVVTVNQENIDKALLSVMPFLVEDKCECGSTDIIWEGRRTKEGFIYINRKCKKCLKTSTLGHNQEGGTVFWKQWEVYTPKQTSFKPMAKPDEPQEYIPY